MPDAVLGKPDPVMIRGIMKRHHLEPHELGMVGDRAYTDMEMARRAGIPGILVLTGETTAELAEALTHRPTWVMQDLGELAARLGAERGGPTTGRVTP
jgi:NagD protein